MRSNRRRRQRRVKQCNRRRAPAWSCQIEAESRLPVPAWGDMGRPRASISRCFPRTPRRSMSVCSHRSMIGPNQRACRSSSRPTWFGTATCLGCSPASCMDSACTARTILAPATASIRRKLVIDPYAKAVARAVRWDDAMFGYRIGDPAADLAPDDRDSAACAPLAAVIDPVSRGVAIACCERHGIKTVIYEAHVKGLTARHPDIRPGTPRDVRGPGHAADHRAPAAAGHHRDRAACRCTITRTIAIWSSAA